MSTEWANNFSKFLLDMGKRPKGLTLERRDNDKGYSKENCYWATMQEQANNKRTNTILEYAGKKMNLKRWANYLGVRYDTLVHRLGRGYTTEKILNLANIKVRGVGDVL